jgi:hypothetical protein
MPQPPKGKIAQGKEGETAALSAMRPAFTATKGIRWPTKPAFEDRASFSTRRQYASNPRGRRPSSEAGALQLPLPAAVSAQVLASPGARGAGVPGLAAFTMGSARRQGRVDSPADFVLDAVLDVGDCLHDVVRRRRGFGVVLGAASPVPFGASRNSSPLTPFGDDGLRCRSLAPVPDAHLIGSRRLPAALMSSRMRRLMSAAGRNRPVPSESALPFFPLPHPASVSCVRCGLRRTRRSAWRSRRRGFPWRYS